MLSGSIVAAVLLVGQPSPWRSDYATALQLARQLGKPLFVVFRCEH